MATGYDMSNFDLHDLLEVHQMMSSEFRTAAMTEITVRIRSIPKYTTQDLQKIIANTTSERLDGKTLSSAHQKFIAAALQELAKRKEKL